MKLADDELKRHYQRFVADNRDLDRKECPSAEELRRAVMNEMRRGRKLNLIDHVFSCSACAQEYETLRLLYQEERKTAGYRPEETALSREDIEQLKSQRPELTEESAGVWERIRAIGVRSLQLGFKHKYIISAASLLIALAGIYLLGPWTEVPEEIYRDAGGEKIVLQAPASAVSSAPDRFQWTQGKQVDYYQVYLLDEELSRLWVSERVSVNSLSLPQEVIEKLEPGKTYFWKVRIHKKDASVEESELRDFKIIR